MSPEEVIRALEILTKLHQESHFFRDNKMTAVIEDKIARLFAMLV